MVSVARLSDSPPEPKALQSWKEIAVYLDRGMRTVQRWHAELRLPVRKVGTGRRSPVIAFPSELDQWMRDRPEGRNDKTTNPEKLETNFQKLVVRQESIYQLTHRTQALRIRFLTNEVNIGLGLANYASRTRNVHSRRRNERNATRAYKEAMRLVENMEFPDRTALQAKIEDLKLALERLSEAPSELGRQAL